MLSTLSSHISPSRSGFPIGAQTVTKDNFAEYLPHIKRTLTLQGGAVGRSLVSGTSLPLLVEPKEFDSGLVIVHADHAVADLRKTDRRYKPHVTGSDHTDRNWIGHALVLSPLRPLRGACHEPGHS